MIWVKVAILRAYELVPEAYSKRFRNHKKTSSQTFVDLPERKAFYLTNGAHRVRLQIVSHYGNLFF